jgi:hypothetical protein
VTLVALSVSPGAGYGNAGPAALSGRAAELATKDNGADSIMTLRCAWANGQPSATTVATKRPSRHYAEALGSDLSRARRLRQDPGLRTPRCPNYQQAAWFPDERVGVPVAFQRFNGTYVAVAHLFWLTRRQPFAEHDKQDRYVKRFHPFNAPPESASSTVATELRSGLAEVVPGT